ncbi:hypothetical protein HKBW3S44_00806 [Candidatus Hakubella thermalkaliphila]|uniref:Uncharacterized protein n=1 Tax=Candidatus Hakubella thermalkaliphila TaxID=2754717 RepID=A0A6V8Q161_9ACTN|nr:hypothetical protein [Candidatus Hakubella thermalkaliphila]GFP37126.1 hypothetical protein HKBW3S44_00806 [Candidatus Hakubella thermalkaliphila]
MKQNKKISVLVFISAVLVIIIIVAGIYYRFNFGRDKIAEDTEDIEGKLTIEIHELIEKRSGEKTGPYLTLEEVVAWVGRVGEIEGIPVRIMKIEGEIHVVEYVQFPFVAFNTGSLTTSGVWLADLRNGTVLLRAEQGQAMLKEQWGRLVPADSIFNMGTGVEGGPWHGFGILQPFGLSPNGNKLGFFLHSRRGGIFDGAIFVGFLDLQTNTPHFTGHGHAPVDGAEWLPKWSPTGAYIYYGRPISRADDPMALANIDVLGGFDVDSVITGQRSFSLPSIEMLTLLFPEGVRAAKEKYKAPDFGGWGSLERLSIQQLISVPGLAT